MELALPEGTPAGQPNCGVVAIAAALRLPYTRVWNRMRKTRHRNWRGGLYNSDVVHELRAISRRASLRWRTTPRMSLRRWVDEHTARDHLYIVNVTSHYVVVMNGVVMDQGGPHPYATHSSGGRRTRSFIDMGKQRSRANG